MCEKIIKMGKGVPIILMFFLCNFIYVPNANAATSDAVLCTKSAVESAIAAASNGDTIIVSGCPGGVTWGSDVVVDKEVTIQGQTTGCPESCVDNTLILNDCFDIQANNVRITGFTFSGSGTCFMVGGVHDFRIDHNKITGHEVASKFSGGKKYGLFDSNLFEDCTDECLYIRGGGNQALADGGLGGGYTDGTVYFEDNIFDLTNGETPKNALDSGAGARWVFRYNTVKETTNFYGVILAAHSHCWVARDGPDNAGTYNQEVYGNTFISKSGRNWGQTLRPRGGRGVYFDNDLTGSGWSGRDAISFVNYETCEIDCSACNVAAHETLGIHSNPWDGLCNNDDGSPPSDYPCPLQVNNYYVWDNTQETGTFSVVVQSGCENYIQEDRDYWDDAGGGDTNFTSDVAANRGSSCTIDDVYWETDNKKLYRCTATDTWTFVYEPYPYPHPLTLGGVDDTTPPTAPSNLITTPISVSQIDLTWDPADDPESGIAYYNVYRDSAVIGTTTTTAYSDAGLTENTTYTYEVSAVNGASPSLESNLSNPAPGTTLPDITPPIITNAQASDQTTVTVVFSEPVEQASAENIGNYNIDNGITITQQPSLATDTVTLTISALTEGITYTLTVNNIKDRASSPNTIATDSQITFDYRSIDPALTGWWKLDEGNGPTANDSSGNGNDGTINGATWTTGKFNGALDFDGIDDYVEIGTNNFNVNAGTLSLWVRASGFTTSYSFIFGHSTIPAFANRIQLYTNDLSGNLDLGLGDSHRLRTDIIGLDTGVWYHIALTWDGTNYNVYVNGSLLANGAYSGLSSLNPFADIGNNGVASKRTQAWDGIIDEVRIYNRTLSQQEVADLAVALPSKPTGWKFEIN